MAVRTVHPVGQGKAVLMNLSPQWYNAYRASGSDPAPAARGLHATTLLRPGVVPWGGGSTRRWKEQGYEITYWDRLTPPRTPPALFIRLP